jgi:predicted heme/steroid binding protein/YHS domain-containing protein
MFARQKLLLLIWVGFLVLSLIAAAALAAPQDWQKKTFTLEQLKQFDGKNGKPAYAAVNGIVYDLSKIGPWKGGQHMKLHYAGKDLTEEFKQAPKDIHSHVLAELPKVGVLAQAKAGVKKSAPPKSAAPKPAPAQPVVKDYKVPSSYYGKLIICPVTNNSFKISPDTLAVRYKGRTYFFCCPACVEPFKANPEKYAKRVIKVQTKSAEKSPTPAPAKTKPTVKTPPATSTLKPKKG